MTLKADEGAPSILISSSFNIHSIDEIITQSEFEKASIMKFIGHETK